MRSGDESRGQGAPLVLDENSELGLALSQALDLPLSALRASMESLSQSLGEERSAWIVAGALEEVDRLERNVRELMEFASPPRPMPLRCTVDEIAYSARSGLHPKQRKRVMLARVSEGATLVVDGPLLARSLRRLIQNALEAGSEHVLVVARRENGAFLFSVVDDAPQPFDSEWASRAFHSTKRNHLGLGLAIAKRDIGLLNGSLDFAPGRAGETRILVTIPEDGEEGGPR